MSEAPKTEAPKPAEKPRLTSEADVTKYKVSVSPISVDDLEGDSHQRIHIQTAGDIVNDVMKQIIELCVEGTKILDICIKGDELIEAATRAVYNKSVKGVKVTKGTCSTPSYAIEQPQYDNVGLAFPTSISVNNAVAHFSPLASVVTY